MDNTAKDMKSKLLTEFSNFQNSLNGNSASPVNAVRIAALENFEKLGFPTLKTEEWKYTNISFINKIDFELSQKPAEHKVDRKLVESLLLKDVDENLLVFVNGFFDKELSMIKSEGIKCSSLAEIIDKNDTEFLQYFSKIADYQNDAFASINTAFAKDGAYINIADNTVIEEPIHLLYINLTDESPLISNPRNMIIAGKHSKIKLVESAHTIGSNPGLTNMVTEIKAEENANIDYFKIQNDDGATYYIGTIQAAQEKGSVFNNTTISLKGKFVRNTLNTIFNDEFASANYFGFYFIDGSDFVDNHTLIDHAKPNCNSNENYKGIIDDNATAVFNGKIMVRRDAQKTSSYQSNKNILLSDNATIDTKPQLEIYADDVKCSHGATSGYLDRDSLFYLRARGIPEPQARALLLNAFSSDIVEKINISELRDNIKQLIANRLGVEDIYFCGLLEK